MLQMEALGDEVVRRGRPRPDPQAYLARYLDQLLAANGQPHRRG